MPDSGAVCLFYKGLDVSREETHKEQAKGY